MSKLNCQRVGCRDVFNAFLVSLARCSGAFEFPVIQATTSIPNKLVAFSKSISCKEFDQWVHFFEDDCLFERLWNHPQRYLAGLKRYEGVILPDFSVYRDMPFAMQIWNIYRSRALGFWLQMNGVKVIANVRYGDRRTYRCCCDGLQKHSTIAIGTHGTLKRTEDREHLSSGLDVVVKHLEPSAIVVYGSAPDSIFNVYRNMGIEIVQFDSDFAASRKAAQ